jgi:hypothetical protein
MWQVYSNYRRIVLWYCVREPISRADQSVEETDAAAAHPVAPVVII